MTPPLPLIIDTDPGVDDVLAILYAMHSPELQIQAITTVHGNTSLENTTRNLFTCLDILSVHKHCMQNTQDKSHHAAGDPLSHRIPFETYSRPVVAVGAPEPIAGHNRFAEHVHGNNGLGGVSDDQVKSMLESFHQEYAMLPDKLYTRSDRTAAQEILHQLQIHEPQTVTLVMLGPLTNLALAMQQDAEGIPTLSRLKQVVVMGGAMHQPIPGGNITPNAEFNFYCDPTAVAMVLGSGLNVLVVPLDVTEMCRLRHGVYADQLVPLAQHAPVPSFVTSFLTHIYNYMTTEAEDLQGGIDVKHADSVQDSALLHLSNEIHQGESSLAMHDPLCMGVVIDPDIVLTTHRMEMTVETCEEAQTKGMCIVDGRRWHRKGLAERHGGWKYPSVGGQGPKSVSVVMRVDTNRFFDRFMRVVFGVRWDAQSHAWRGIMK